MFLLLFSYTIIFEFHYERNLNTFIVSNQTNNTNNIDYENFYGSGIQVSFFEILLLIWVMSLVVEELKQVLDLKLFLKALHT